MIADGALDDGSIEALASQVSLSAGHFEDYFLQIRVQLRLQCMQLADCC